MCGTKDILDFDPYLGTNMFKQADIRCIHEIYNFFLKSPIFSYMKILLPGSAVLYIKLSLTWGNVMPKFNQ